MKRLSLIVIFFIPIYFSYARFFNDKLIGKQIAIFYPADYNSANHQPSFALLEEPKPKGKIPKNWKEKPHFYFKDGKQIAAFAIPEGCSLYGTGEVTGRLLRNDTKITLWNTDNFMYSLFDGERLYQSHPWILGVNRDGSAFGIIADNTWRQQIELTDSIRFISEGPAFRVIVILRNSPQEIVKELATLTGKIDLPPLWALGYQQSRYSYVPDTRIKSIADTFRLKKLPCDVLWMDIDYMDHFKIFSFDKNKIPDPKGLNDYLHKKGFKTVWMINPGVKVEKNYFVYESGNEGNHWVKDEKGQFFKGIVWPGICVFPDFTRPETCEWWSNLYPDFMATGINGIWNDMNEPSVFDGPDGTMPPNNWHRGGGELYPGIHLRYHNVYGMLMAKATKEGILKANPNKRPFVLSRAGYLGSARYAATWTGDNCSSFEHMKMSIPMTLNLGLSGQPFNGPDLGGFALNATDTLFGQWIAMGVFFPFARGHAAKDVNNKEPWAFGHEIENVARTALNRRYQLLPYYYTLFYDASVVGLPIMRPVFFADPKDTALCNEDQIFLVGDGLLIIPKWAKNPAIPKGIWRTFSFLEENSISDSYQVDVKIKGGTIIPMGKIIQNTSEYSTDSLILQVCLDEHGRAMGKLYEDAGDGFEYKKGEYRLSSFSALTKDSSVNVAIHQIDGKFKPRQGYYKVIILDENGKLESPWTKNNIIKVKIK